MMFAYEQWVRDHADTTPHPSAAEMQELNRKYGFHGTHLSDQSWAKPRKHKSAQAPKPQQPSFKERLQRVELANTMLREQALHLESERDRLRAEVEDGKRMRKKLKRELDTHRKKTEQADSLRRGIRKALIHCHPDKTRDGRTDAAKMTRVLLALLEQ